MSRRSLGRPLMFLGVIGLTVMVLLAGCAPTASVPTPTPTKPATQSAAPAATVAPTSAAKPTAAAQSTTTVSKPTGKPISFGHITALSGIGSPYGWSDSIAMDMAVKEINDSGGINGSPLQIVRTDSPWDPKIAVSRLREMADSNKVVGVWGPFASTEFEVTAPLANELKLPSFGNPVVAGIAANNRPWTFQLSMESNVWVPPSVDAFKQKYPDAKRIVITGDTKNRATQFDVTDIYPKTLKDRGLEVIGIMAFETGATDFSALATKIKDANPDGVVVSGLYAQNIGLAAEFKRLNYHPPMILSAIGFSGGSVMKTAPEFVEGTIIPFWADLLSDDPSFKKFNETWQANLKADTRIPEGQKFPYIATEGMVYSGMLSIGNIMRKAGITGDTPLDEARIKIRDGFQNIGQFSSIFGPVKVLPSGQTTWNPAVLTVEGGKLKTLLKP